MTHPHVSQADRDALDDLGLVGDDHRIGVDAHALSDVEVTAQ